MKNSAIVVLAIALLISSALQLLRPTPVAAQTTTNGTLVILQVGAPSTCVQPSGVTITNGLTLCATTSGLYYALNGSAIFTPVAGSVTVPVTSVFARTGAIVKQAGDYNYADLGLPPTTISCTAASIATGSSGTLTASGCTIK